PAAVSNKKRLSHTKRLSLSSDQSVLGLPEPTTSVLFAESPLHPGVPIVYRTPEEKSPNPDRLNLDRRHLSVCPILEGEEKLRLLNLQHNSITRLQHLNGLRQLVFLDLYDNFVREISGLEGLMSLRVLMLGKNRICKISGLRSPGETGCARPSWESG
ncbi:Leucine-rich repeat-containing protein 49, partial [Geodia barretti]